SDVVFGYILMISVFAALSVVAIAAIVFNNQDEEPPRTPRRLNFSKMKFENHQKLIKFDQDYTTLKINPWNNVDDHHAYKMELETTSEETSDEAPTVTSNADYEQTEETTTTKRRIATKRTIIKSRLTKRSKMINSGAQREVWCVYDQLRAKE